MRSGNLAATAAVIALAMVGFTAPVASAADSLESAIANLQKTSVYVEPGTPGTDSDTTGYLQKFLKPDDHIVLVMMDESDLPNDEAAQVILDSLPEPSILGLYVNDQVTVHNNRDTVPQAAVNDAMENAKAISVKDEETLATFTRLMHEYQAENPEPVEETGSSAIEVRTDSPSAIVPLGGGALLAVILLVAILAWLRKKSRQSTTDAVTFEETPPSVRELAIQVLKLRSQLHDPRLVESLTNTGVYLEAYFRNATMQTNGSYKSVDEIRANVARLLQVTQEYLRGQEKPRLFREIEARQQRFSVAITSFETFMLEQVRNANEDRDFDVQQAANILSASDLRSIRPEGEPTT